MNRCDPNEPSSDPAESPPIIATPSRSIPPKPFSRLVTIIFSVLAIAAFLVRNWPYVADSRMAVLSTPDTTALWVLHENMLIHGGAEKMTKGRKAFLAVVGLRFDDIPEDCEEMLRDTIAHLDSPSADRTAIDGLRAHLAVLLAETGSLTNAVKELDLLSNSNEAVGFIREFHSIYEIQ